MSDNAPVRLHRETMIALDELEAAEWFVNVGRGSAKHALLVRSWTEASAWLQAPSSEEVRLEAANGISSQLLGIDRIMYSQWNDRVELLKPLTEALVQENDLPPDPRPRIA